MKNISYYYARLHRAVAECDTEFFLRHTFKLPYRCCNAVIRPFTKSVQKIQRCFFTPRPRQSAFLAKMSVNYVYTPDPELAFSACPVSRPPRWGKGAMPDDAKMTIVHYIGTLGPGGAERQCAYAAASQVAQGHEVWIVTHHLESKFDHHYLPLALEKGVKHAVLPHWKQAKSLIDGFSLDDAEILFRCLPPDIRYDVLSLMLFLERTQPDIMHTWLELCNIQGVWGGLLAGVPRIIMNVRSVSLRHFPHTPSAVWLHEQFSLLAKHERVSLLFNSKAGAEDYADWLGLPVSDMHVVHNGTDTDIKAAPISETRAKLGIPANVPVLLGVFRLGHEKRPLLFLETAGLLHRRLPALRVLVAGEGTMREEMEQYISANGLKKFVTLLGRREDIPDLLRAADAMLFTSGKEGFPNVLQEAQACGCPVVCTDAGDAAEIVKNGETGIVCQVNTAATTLCEHLARLMTDKAVAQEMADAGMRRIKALYSFTVMDKALRAYYHRLFAPEKAEGTQRPSARRRDALVVAIQPEQWQDYGSPDKMNCYSRHWIEYFADRGHQVKIVDVRSPDIVERIRGCDGFMWRWRHYGGDGHIAKRLLPVVEYQLGRPVFPSQATCRHFDDKAAQEFLFEAAGVPRPKTWIWFDRDKALDWLETAAPFPMVLKLPTGAGSVNVLKIEDCKEARYWVHRLFEQGLFSLEKGNKAKKIIKHCAHVWQTGYAPDPGAYYYDFHKGYILFQQFLPDNGYDTRATVIGERCFVYRRFNRPDDFRASGSGNFCVDQSKIDPGFVHLAFDTAKKLGTQSVAIDGLYDGARHVLAEISYTYVAWMVQACHGYWRLDGEPYTGVLRFVDDPIWPGTAQAEDFEQLLLARREKHDSH
ncbi:MAG: glycosyltransferase [Desulfovibrio sp.]|jgi:glycosyltransferase involved in cell wall biosynthesis|nr:glycosyltransferase [Desulfovibrio sp.]